MIHGIDECDSGSNWTPPTHNFILSELSADRDGSSIQIHTKSITNKKKIQGTDRLGHMKTTLSHDTLPNYVLLISFRYH